MAAVGVGVEAIVPSVFGPLKEGLGKHYGLSHDDLAWFHIHVGDIEMEHGNDGLLVLEKYVSEWDTEMQRLCREAIERNATGIARDALDDAYNAEA